MLTDFVLDDFTLWNLVQTHMCQALQSTQLRRLTYFPGHSMLGGYLVGSVQDKRWQQCSLQFQTGLHLQSKGKTLKVDLAFVHIFTKIQRFRAVINFAPNQWTHSVMYHPGNETLWCPFSLQFQDILYNNSTHILDNPNTTVATLPWAT